MFLCMLQTIKTSTGLVLRLYKYIDTMECFIISKEEIKKGVSGENFSCIKNNAYYECLLLEWCDIEKRYGKNKITV